MAKRKRARIVAREGDANGERLKPYYLALLKAEIAEQNMFSQTCLQNSKQKNPELMDEKENPTTKIRRILNN